MTGPTDISKGSREFDDFQALLSSWPPTRPGSPGPSAQAAVVGAVEALTVESTRLANEVDAVRRHLHELERELERVRSEERRSAVAVLRTVIGVFAIRSDELEAPVQGAPGVFLDGAQLGGEEPPAAEPVVGAGLYLGPNGEVWLGRGRRPTWLKQALLRGGELADYWKAGLDLGSTSGTSGDDSPSSATAQTSKETVEPQLTW